MGELYQCLSFERIFWRSGGEQPSGSSGLFCALERTRHLISSRYSRASEMVANPLGMQNSSSRKARLNIRFVRGVGASFLLLRSAREGPSRRMKAQSNSSSMGAEAEEALGFMRELR